MTLPAQTFDEVMTKHLSTLMSALVCLLIFCVDDSELQADQPKVKVFLLAGQSNMEGYGMLGSLEHLGQHPQYGHLIKRLKGDDGSWATRNDVTIYWNKEDKEDKHGPLSTNWGAMTGESIGPELMFGTIMGDHFEEPVLLIKTAWGGKSVWCDFRSPSAGEMTWEEKRILKRDNWLQPGRYYRQMVTDINHCLVNIADIVPGYDGQGCELVGMAWFQGWNDFGEWHLQLDDKPVGEALIERYPHNLAAMIRDLRKDLNAPALPIVIGELGVFGHEAQERARDEDEHEARAMVKFRAAQQAVVEDPSLSNVTLVPTADFWDTRLQQLRVLSDEYWQVKQEKNIEDSDDNVLPTKELSDEYWRLGGHWVCHYNGSATTYCLVGHALATALLEPAATPNTKRDSPTSTNTIPPLRVDPLARNIEGWKVHVDPALIAGDHREEGERALQMLANHLQRIKILVPDTALAKLQTIEIWIDHDHPRLNGMHYHPSKDWLVGHGHDPRLARKVHITEARQLLSREQMLKHPAVVLHELAHGYHDQVLGFDNKEIVKVFEAAKKQGIYTDVLLYTGDTVRHYGLSNHKEYFAETEAFFYRNDFYPFVRAELRRHDPALHDLLGKVWGLDD